MYLPGDVLSQVYLAEDLLLQVLLQARVQQVVFCHRCVYLPDDVLYHFISGDVLLQAIR